MTTALEQYTAYQFEQDTAYQQGLASIIAGGALNGDPSPEVRDEILRKTRIFYFNRITGNSITPEEALQAELKPKPTAQETNAPVETNSTSAKPSAVSEEARVLTFAELQQLIESGRIDQIPNNKLIPEIMSSEAPSVSTTAVRRKPWETTAVPTAVNPLGAGFPVN